MSTIRSSSDDFKNPPGDGGDDAPANRPILAFLHLIEAAERRDGQAMRQQQRALRRLGWCVAPFLGRCHQ